MACETCLGGKIDWYYNTANNIFYTNSGCAGPVTNQGCTDWSGSGFGCTSMCSGCGGPFTTTNGSGVVTCYTNASCGTPCVTVDELPFNRQAAWWGLTAAVALVAFFVVRRFRLRRLRK